MYKIYQYEKKVIKMWMLKSRQKIGYDVEYVYEKKLICRK